MRVKDLIGRMTLEEKVGQMVNHAPAIPRLGIPAYDWWNEGLHGVARAGIATVFPQAIGMAATFDAPLVQRAGDIVSTEARVKYVEAQHQGLTGRYRGLTLWSPNINIFRDPRWGRGQETYGEDPLLTATLGSAYIRGLQGTDAHYLKVIATAKHFAVHSGPEPLRHVFDARPSAHDLEDTYLPAFKAAVEEGHVYSVMCSYNALDGVPACASSPLLQNTLRERWKFGGFVVSDCGAIHDIALTHKAAKDIAEASAMAVRAGTDLDCDNEYLQLPEALAAGSITQQEIDRSLERVLTARFRLGLFDPVESNPCRTLRSADSDSPAHRAAALEAAMESLTLLKNEHGILPFGRGVKRIAVIGPNAESLEVLEGEYNGTPRAPITLLDGMRAVFKGKAEVEFAQGSPISQEVASPVPAYEFGAGQGLKAEYFANEKFAGTPALVRTDGAVNVDWRQASPIAGLATHGYSVRWSGTFTPTVSGTVKLGTQRGFCWDCTTPDPVRVYIDGKLLTDDPGTGKANQVTLSEITLQRGVPLSVRVDYVNTSGEGEVALVWRPPLDEQRAQAVALAQRSDAVVMTLGISPALEGEEMPVKVPGFAGGDRTTLDLPAAQRELFRAVAATGKPVVVVLTNGSAVALHEIAEKADAVLEAWYPGEEGGRAVAEALAGTFSPAGRLPVTFYKDVSQLPLFEDYSMANRTYRYMRQEPAYGFGYGLSYTTFEYRNIIVKPTADGFAVSADLVNRGKRDSDEVVQVYLTPPHTPVGPKVELAAFRRVHLRAGEHQNVRFDLPASRFELVNEEGKRVKPHGTYGVWVGGGQPASGLPGISKVDFKP